MSALAWATSWRAALRISRREVLRHKARSALIVAMLGLPVLGVTAAETVLDSAQDLPAQEQVTRAVGATDAFVYSTYGEPIHQSTDVNAFWFSNDNSQNPPSLTSGQVRSDKAILAALPRAALLPEDVSYGIFAHGPGGYAIPEYYQLDFSNPALSGAFDLASGRLPHTATEVDLSPAVASALDARVGGTVSVPGSSTHDGRPASFTVVGLMRQPTAMTGDTIYALPSAPPMIGESHIGWFVLNHGGVTWSQVEQLNKGGYRVVSRDVVLNPPPRSQTPYDLQAYGVPGNVRAAEVAVATIAVGIALLEVVLLAGPAFAVSARRREREYAMLGAVGADATHLRRIVLADGLVLGAIAGVLGAGLGFGTGAITLAFMARYAGRLPGAVHVDVVRVLLVVLLAIGLGLCSALAPALSVAKREILSALNGRRTVVARRVRIGRLVLGLVLIVLGVVAEYVFGGRGYTDGGVDVVVGIALIEVGCILCTPAIIRLLAKFGRVLPLGPRLTLRDGARNSGRTTPAVAAMFAAVAGAVAAGGWIQSGLDQQRAGYQPALLPNQVAVVGVANGQQASAITAKLRGVLPVADSMLTQSAGRPGAPNDWQVSFMYPGQTPCPSDNSTANSDSTSICGEGSFGGATPQSMVGGPQVFREVTGFDDAQADAVLEQGGVVLFTAGIVQNGKVTLDAPAGGKGYPKAKYLTIPAVYVPVQGYPDPGFILAPKTAQAMGIADGTQTLLLDLSSHADATQQFAANQILDGFGVSGGLMVEDGFHSDYPLANEVVLLAAMFVAIGAAAIATGLALADGRADQETLVAVGGSPWTRRWLAGSTALVVTGLGVLIGVPIGFLIAAGLVKVGNVVQFGPASRTFAVPWLDLGGVALAVPLLTALGAMLLSRSKAPGSGRALS